MRVWVCVHACAPEVLCPCSSYEFVLGFCLPITAEIISSRSTVLTLFQGWHWLGWLGWLMLKNLLETLGNSWWQWGKGACIFRGEWMKRRTLQGRIGGKESSKGTKGSFIHNVIANLGLPLCVHLVGNCTHCWLSDECACMAHVWCHSPHYRFLIVH